MENLLSLLLGLFILFLIVYYIKFYIDKAKYKKLAEERYTQALKSGNKAEALHYGRIYYSILRDGNLTIYDEQAITNDVNCYCREKE